MYCIFKLFSAAKINSKLGAKPAPRPEDQYSFYDQEKHSNMMNQTVTYAVPGKYDKKEGIANVPFTAQQGTSTQMYINSKYNAGFDSQLLYFFRHGHFLRGKFCEN